MELIDKLIHYFKKPEQETLNETPEGICPVCWGYQQYDGKIRTLMKDQQIDINNHQVVRPFFKKIIKTHVEGIKLKDPKIEACPQCTESKTSKAKS